MMKKVVQLNDAGYFCGLSDADESPLEPGVYLYPAGSFDIPAPIVPDGQIAKWHNDLWVFEELPKPEPEPEIKEFTYAEHRLLAYPPIADYLDGVVKGDQAQIQKYISDCLAVKAKYPKPQE